MITASEILVLLYHDTMSLICFVFPHGTCYYPTLRRVSIFTLYVTIYLFANLFMSVSPTRLCGHKHCFAHCMPKFWNDNRYTVGAKKNLLHDCMSGMKSHIIGFQYHPLPLKQGLIILAKSKVWALKTAAKLRASFSRKCRLHESQDHIWLFYAEFPDKISSCDNNLQIQGLSTTELAGPSHVVNMASGTYGFQGSGKERIGENTLVLNGTGLESAHFTLLTVHWLPSHM